MPISYTQCGDPVHAIAQRIMLEHHKELKLSDGSYPTLCLMFVAGAADDGAPLKLHGYPAVGVASVIPHKQRADKRSDAEFLLDEKWWESSGEREREALIDHLITHLEIAIDDAGLVKTDDQGRPKLRLKLCDWNLRGFRSIAERYGDAAPEVQALRAFENTFGASVGDKLFA